MPWDWQYSLEAAILDPCSCPATKGGKSYGGSLGFSASGHHSGRLPSRLVFPHASAAGRTSEIVWSPLVSLAAFSLWERKHGSWNKNDPRKLNPPCQQNLMELNT